jgi:hypothetical protein
MQCATKGTKTLNPRVGKLKNQNLQIFTNTPLDARSGQGRIRDPRMGWVLGWLLCKDLNRLLGQGRVPRTGTGIAEYY